MRTQLSKIAYAAIVGIALTFTLSCGDHNPFLFDTEKCGDKEYKTSEFTCVGGELVGKCMGADYYPAYQTCNNGRIENNTPDASSSSSGAQSSSSLSSSGNGKKGKGNDIANYRTVKIGTQTWMAENLNYNVSGSKCYGEDGLVQVDEDGGYITLSNSEIQANCDKYGRLYNWATAMALPSNCNDDDCSSRISAKHGGICPSGWHIPNDADWKKLMDFVGGSYIAGTELKATSGWDDYYENSGNGTDDYGFFALPGGGGNSYGYFGNVGILGYWWSTESGDAIAYYRYIYHKYAEVFKYSDSKTFLNSVRCLQD